MSTEQTRASYDAEQKRKIEEEKRQGLTDFDKRALEDMMRRLTRPILSIYKERPHDA